MQKQYHPPTVERRPVGALSRKDAAAYLSSSTRQLDNYASANLIPRIKLGAKTVFRVCDLDAFLESRLRPDNRHYYCIEQAASILGISTEVARKLFTDGHLWSECASKDGTRLFGDNDIEAASSSLQQSEASR